MPCQGNLAQPSQSQHALVLVSLAPTQVLFGLHYNLTEQHGLRSGEKGSGVWHSPLVYYH